MEDDVATAIDTLAHRHGITAAAEPVDAFVNAVTRLCSDIEVTFDHTERLLLGLAHAGIVTNEQRFTLHTAYLHQRSRYVRFTQ